MSVYRLLGLLVIVATAVVVVVLAVKPASHELFKLSDKESRHPSAKTTSKLITSEDIHNVHTNLLLL